MRRYRVAVIGLWLLCSGLQAVAVGNPLSVNEIAPGVFVHNGKQEEMSAKNLGDIANNGFVVGQKCVAVIDTGGSLNVGEALLSAVKLAIKLPICYVINTHGHPDHIFGNAAFKADKPRFIGHAKLPAAEAARGNNYVRTLRLDIGAAAAGSEIIPPDSTVSDTLDLDLGGRILKVRAWRTAHTDNDLTVYDEQSGTLFLGDLLFVERIPVVDGSIRGWLAIMPELRGIKARHIVPGHGKVDASWPEALMPEESYLKLLAKEVRLALKDRLTLQQAVDTVGLSERGKWLLFDDYHRRNVTAAYAELEWED